MADLKISQLTGATTPLAGTEVLPVVQSGATKKVAVADLTAGRVTAVGNNSTVGTSSVFPFISSNGLKVGNDANSATRVLVGNQDTGASAFTGIAFEAAGGGWQMDVPPDVATFANPLIGKFNNTEVFRFTSDGSHLPGVDAGPSIGSGAKRWNTIYAATGTINTSDARFKTKVSAMTDAEINASKQLAKEIGTYKFLDAVAAKGNSARIHVGMTVQRVIEIMDANGLDPMAYGFICYDKWDDVFVHHSAQEAHNGLVDEDGAVLIPAQEAKDAWVEQTQVAGDRYGFRLDELIMFITRGFEARLAALEAT